MAPVAIALEIETPKVALQDIPATVIVSDATPGALVNLRIGEMTLSAPADDDGAVTFDDVAVGDTGIATLSARAGGDVASRELRVLPGWVSITPPLVAIIIADAILNYFLLFRT